ncbi:LacI family DNA-binding transcriptional regulator [Bifidobacterium sp. 82T24]|uniref:LacI family DNA-binding transcriptional regulator n=1 Tax=Bifidobacterium pluvialisilvae TaxID=2834436 RepID=UPI001C581FDD|nr:LacI family DNA-binding transcriptional regulator [Bifidobacterium pluvialisilvae]MBW3089037.1 LacI family DNA-binding transcriptional regulator [Bifidobacterium pluvialisilvae]
MGRYEQYDGDEARHRGPGPARTGNVNIRDIAKAAGVSTATVSRVMRGGNRVSEVTRAKVQRVIEELGYIPNAHALALTTPPNSVTFVVDHIYGGTYGEMTAGVEREAADRKMTFRLQSTGGDWDDPKPILDNLLSQRSRLVVLNASDVIGSPVDGILNDYVDRFASVGTDVVVIARPRMDLDPRIAVVDYANESGMYELTKYMISLGHRSFMFVGRKPDSSVFTARYHGFLRALGEAGIAYDDRVNVPIDDDRDSVIANVMAAYPMVPGCTAVVAVTDAMALYTIAALRKLGRNVPADVSVGGFDDMPFAEDLVVPMTTVHAPFGNMGHMAVKIALDGLGRDVTMPTQLKIRGSVAVAPAR